MSLQDDLLAAYEKTQYYVAASPPFILRVNCSSAELGKVHDLYGVDCSFYITAFNPFSEVKSQVENCGAHKTLLRYVRQQGWSAIEGEGVDPGGEWASETSLLVLGASEQDARATGSLFKQNAILWMGADVTPRLILLGQ